MKRAGPLPSWPCVGASVGAVSSSFAREARRRVLSPKLSGCRGVEPHLSRFPSDLSPALVLPGRLLGLSRSSLTNSACVDAPQQSSRRRSRLSNMSLQTALASRCRKSSTSFITPPSFRWVLATALRRSVAVVLSTAISFLTSVMTPVAICSIEYVLRPSNRRLLNPP